MAVVAADPLLVPETPGPFTVQWLDGQWYVGDAGAAQRIADAATLDAWLTVNARDGRGALDFDGDASLRARFVTEFGPLNPTAAPAPGPAASA